MRLFERRAKYRDAVETAIDVIAEKSQTFSSEGGSSVKIVIGEVEHSMTPDEYDYLTNMKPRQKLAFVRQVMNSRDFDLDNFLDDILSAANKLLEKLPEIIEVVRKIALLFGVAL